MTRLADARTAVADTDRALVANAAAVHAARAEFAGLAREGARAADRARVARRVATLERERARLLEGRTEAARRVDGLRDALLGGRGFEAAVEELDGRVPITLLPVRLETRYTADRQRLRVRIYPDTAHQDGHEPELTAQETEAAKEYWLTRWQRRGAEEDAQAWRDLARAFRPSRARWIVEVMTPTNVNRPDDPEPTFPDPDERPAPWTRAPTARALPERWLLVGYRGGEEIVRKWGDRIDDDLPMGPAPDLTDDDTPDDEPADEQDALAVDDDLRWIVDYAAAEQRGMAITVEQGDLTNGRLDAGFDLLLVVSVDWTLDPGAAAQQLEEHLAAHRYSDGLALLPVGTPTNVTADDPDAGGGDLDRNPDLLAPGADPAVPRSGAGVRLREALGLPEGSVLEVAPGAADTTDTDARHMNNALWAPTWGYFFEQVTRPLVGSVALRDLHDHFRRFVRGRGPLPTLRLGAQPYGVLPVLAAGNWRAPEDGIDGALMRRFPSLRAQWLHSAARITGLGDSVAADEVLVDILRRTPRSETFRFRKATGRSLTASLVGLGLLGPFQEQLAKLMLALAGISGRPDVVDILLAEDSEALPVPLVMVGDLSDTDPVDPNYFTQVLAQLSRAGGFLSLVEDPETARSLLEALIRHAAQLEMSRTTYELILQVEVAAGVMARSTAVPREREIHIAEAPTPRVRRADEPQGPASRLEGPDTLLELALQPVAEISGRSAIANHVATTSNAELRRRVATRRFAEFRASLDHLAGVPSAEVGRLAAETLDCCSHRLDAWITSVATRRLHDLRAAGVGGTHLGGYGWVEDLRPSPAGASLGYVHAPSVSQAATSAILRSGHLSRRASADSVLAIDLSSQRVAKAHAILDGMRAGQPVGALLGYRFERGLRDLRLAKYILEFRRAAPLDTATDGFDDGQPLETVAARDVVDGHKLARRAMSDDTALLNEVGVNGADRPAVRAELAELVAALDAVSDVLVSESVHQAVFGNMERSGAALDAMDRQTGIPEASVIRTPRTGVGIGHRVVVALSDTGPPLEWAGLDDPRGDAEPRLNAWLARAIGDPEFVRVRALAKDDEGATLAALDVRLSDLGLSPLSTVLAAMGGGANEVTELQERLVHHMLDTAPEGTAGLEFQADPPPGSPRSALGLAELMDLCAALGDFVSSCRHGTAADFAAPNQPAGDGLDAAELKRRADAAVAALRRARDDVPGSGENPGVPRLRRVLLGLADAGVRGAVPASDDREALLEQTGSAADAADAVLGKLDSLEAGFERSGDNAAAQVAHDLGRLRLLFGEHCPAAPRCVLANAAEVAGSLSASAELLGGDPLAPTVWLEQHALVRAPVGRLLRALTESEIRGRGLEATQVDVIQLPHLPGDRWVGLPTTEDAPPHAGATALVVHHPSPLDAHEPLAVWVVDQWSEVLPRRSETTGVSFHFDAPGSRPPQAVLVAVPPDPDKTGWLLGDVIGSVREAQELTRMRAVDLDHLEAVGRFLPALYFAFNLERKTPSLDLWALADVATEIANTAFLERRGGTP